MGQSRHETSNLSFYRDTADQVRELSDAMGVNRLDLADRLMRQALADYEIEPPARDAITLRRKSGAPSPPPTPKPARGRPRNS